MCAVLKRPLLLNYGRAESKKRHLHAHRSVPFIHNPEAPFGLESFDPELTTEGLMAERRRPRHLLGCKRQEPVLSEHLLPPLVATLVQTLHLHFNEHPLYFTAEALRTLRKVFFHVLLRGRHVKRISALSAGGKNSLRSLRLCNE